MKFIEFLQKYAQDFIQRRDKHTVR